MWREINAIINDHQHFVVTTHVNPDGDGIGAACALIELLRLQNKEVRLVCDSPIPEKFHFLDFHGVFESYDENCGYEDVEVLIVLDTQRRKRIGRLAELLRRDKVTSICIDHHQPAETFTQYVAIDSNACAVGALVYTLFKASGFPLNREAATGIYASILCDTGRFCYASTTRKAHKIADECIKLGVNPTELYSKLFQQLSIDETELFADALRSMEYFYDKKVVFLTLRSEAYSDKSLSLAHMDLEYVHEFAKMIRDVECVALFRELGPKQVRLSIRSKAEHDMQLLVKDLGGGGHAAAAGVHMDLSLDFAKEKILLLLQDYFPNLQPCEKPVPSLKLKGK